ncbi:MAG TPA: cytochrome c [Geobacteraceae bacterium]
MKRIAQLAVLAVSPLLVAALWMDEQPSYKAYKAPVLSPPADSVPVSGKEIVSRESELHNPVAPTAASVAQGKMLFEINCAMCHGHTSVQRGPVGQKLKPPPPGLAPEMVQGLRDSDIFKAITFGFGRMPPFRERLMSPERWDLVNFLRSRK